MKNEKNAKEKRIGDTVYVVEHCQCDCANETVEEKLERMILNNLENNTMENIPDIAAEGDL